MSIKTFELSTINYSKYYYLVLRLTDDTLKSLSTGELKGLQGISTSTSIINSWFDIRDLMLVMKREDVENCNKLTVVDYDDVDALVKDDLKLLRRLYDKCDNYGVGSLLYQGIRKTSYLNLKKNNRHGYYITSHKLAKLHKKVRWGMWKQYDNFDRDTHSLNNLKNIKDYNDLLNKTLKLLNKKSDRYTMDEIDSMLKYTILGFANCFKHEQEVIVKDKSFTIPNNSTLFIKEQYPDSFTFEKNTPLVDQYIPILNDRFNIKKLKFNHSKRGIISHTHKPTFGYIRYLDKMF